VASERQTLSLAEVYDFSSGLSKPRSEFGFGYPFLSFKDVFYNSAVPKQITELVQSTEQERARCSVMRGDVFLTRTSETMDELGMSSVALADIPDATFNGFTKRLRPKRDLIAPGFARYFFRSPEFRAAVNSMSTMSTRASLNNEMLERLTITFPEYAEQEAIAHVLGTLDDKIELNRKMNETLEAMAQALFKSWFVDFDPVRAKAEGRDPGLPAHIAALFPDSFEESELGEIPMGWKWIPFANTVEIMGGGTPKTSVAAYWDGDIPWFSVVDAPSASDVWTINTEKKITRAGAENSSTKVLAERTTIISARGTVGRVALVGVPMAMNQSCYGLRGLTGALGTFTYFATRNAVSLLQQGAHGSVFDTITRESFMGVHVALPPDALVDAYEQMVESRLQRIRSSLFQSRTLASLRDVLLPKLISGEIRVDQAERVVSEAGA